MNPPPSVKGQGRVYPVHVRVPIVFMGRSLGILGDEKTHKYPRTIGPYIKGFPMLGPRYIQRTSRNPMQSLDIFWALQGMAFKVPVWLTIPMRVLASLDHLDEAVLVYGL